MKKWNFMLIFLIINLNLLSLDTIRVKGRDGSSWNYYMDLLGEVMQRTVDEYGDYQIEAVSPMTQARSIEELKRDRIDLDWIGTDKKREEELRAIRVPLLGGLLGYRVPVIKTRDKKYFDDIYTKEDLALVVAIQGSQWPDAKILSDNGLKLITVSDFKHMYPMLIHDRAEYFPREITNAYSEVKKNGEGEVEVYEDLLIHYNFPMYYFVNKDDGELAKRIEDGLMEMVEDGSLRKFIENHPATADTFPLEKFNNSRIIYLENNSLPEETPLDNEKLWIKI